MHAMSACASATQDTRGRSRSELHSIGVARWAGVCGSFTGESALGSHEELGFVAHPIHHWGSSNVESPSSGPESRSQAIHHGARRSEEHLDQAALLDGLCTYITFSSALLQRVSSQVSCFEEGHFCKHPLMRTKPSKEHSGNEACGYDGNDRVYCVAKRNAVAVYTTTASKNSK